MILLENVSKTYPGRSDVHALREVSLRIDEGQWVSIVGPSGAGKSTLLTLLGLLDTPTAGVYRLDEQDVSRLSPSKRAELRAQRFAFVFQNFHMVSSRSTRENIELGMVYAGVARPERRARAEEAINGVGLAHRAEADVSTLSGGEKQRAVIARALASRAQILLCDEPTGNLDRETGRHVFQAITQLHGAGATVVVVTHDQEVAHLGQRVIEVVDGRIARGG